MYFYKWSSNTSNLRANGKSKCCIKGQTRKLQLKKGENTNSSLSIATIDCYQDFWLLSLPLSLSLEKLVSPCPGKEMVRINNLGMGDRTGERMATAIGFMMHCSRDVPVSFPSCPV